MSSRIKAVIAGAIAALFTILASDMVVIYVRKDHHLEIQLF